MTASPLSRHAPTYEPAQQRQSYRDSLAYRRSDRLGGLLRARPTPALLAVLGGALAALAIAIYVPAVAAVFRFAPLAPGDILVALAAAGAGVFFVLTLLNK